MRALALLAPLIVAAACASAPVEEPAYDLRLADGAFEVRTYAPTILAETTVQGDAFGSRFEGFGPLADYIFAKERDGEKIAMTAPVTQHSTTPNEWTIGFTMPADYAMDTLPAPADRDVTLKQQPAQTMAVLKFTGLATARDMDEAKRALMQKVAAANLVTKGEPVFAFYDPPWTLAFMRRNEVMIEVARRAELRTEVPTLHFRYCTSTRPPACVHAALHTRGALVPRNPAAHRHTGTKTMKLLLPIAVIALMGAACSGETAPKRPLRRLPPK